MQFWVIILSSVLIAVVCSIDKPYEKQRRIFNVLCFVLVVVTSLRCGLGEDYARYIEKIEWYSNVSGNISFLDEPLFILIAKFINNTIWTPALFFLLMAILSLVGVFSFYNREENNYLPLTIIFFVLFPALYFNTMNIVRQFAATGIFFFSLRYIENRKFLKYLLCVVLASSLHVSSLILIPFYFILAKPLSKKATMIICIMGLVLFYSITPFLSFLDTANIYNVYLDTEDEMGSSSVIILYNVLLLLCLLRKKKQENSYDTISTNLLLFLVILSDLSFANYYFYRLSVFFMPIAAYMLPKVIGDLFGRPLACITTVIISVALFLVFFIPNMNNPLIVRDGLLPLTSFFNDTIYQQAIR